MLRTAKDMRIEYENGEQLKRIRHSYITHLVDYVCQDRDRVFANDKISYDERHKNKVTVDNVFDIAKKREEQKNSREKTKNEPEQIVEDEEEDSDAEEAEEELYDDEVEEEELMKKQNNPGLVINQNDMLKTTAKDEVSKAMGDDSRD